MQTSKDEFLSEKLRAEWLQLVFSAARLGAFRASACGPVSGGHLCHCVTVLFSSTPVEGGAKAQNFR